MRTTKLRELISEMKALGDSRQAVLLSGFFKTGKGEYGEGDVFLGIKVPVQRQIAKKYSDLDISDIEKLLKSKIHEHRLTGLIILVKRYGKSDEAGKEEMFRFYLDNAERINNWDLVDLSAPNIAGDFLLRHPEERMILKRLASSKNLWERRIAILSTFAFIREGELSHSLRLTEVMLNDSHDLIHKAVGWMLREVGKREAAMAETFLQAHYQRMPRTMLRYAIERFPEPRRQAYLRGEDV
jgi:3-methyladenine DNA glycosylase AlkD